MTSDGFYKGKKVMEVKIKEDTEEQNTPE
jgi:hypothetical protein